ncbi:hypothetical protein [Mycolicibacterium duvalii]|uniref:hypothetical protein n=1 Tax=Mycolicibacterium duvalii TaxID=39688 RepID=UPI0015D3FE5B|nr:hypothetical protein [Mycolicibacterium duvalii]MCV7369309.1 hypothetical protein [Mycolicibacterium duvalii]
MSGADSDIGGAGRQHRDIPPELRQLAQSILDRLDPAIRLAAARMQATGDNPGRCQQVWCPVCALAALVSGEQHPLLSVVAEHSVALLTLVRALVDTMDDDRGPQPPDGGQPGPPPRPEPDGPPGRYQHIPVIVEE